MPIDLLNFVRKWEASSLSERSAAQQHFRDLCEVLGVDHPTQSDEIGASYTFEKRVTKTGSSDQGYADVWKRGFFAWEYKSKGGDLKKAYRQLNEYHEALENPPLLVVCDFARFEVHTKFENLPSRTYAFALEDLLHQKDTATSALPPLEVLRHVFGDFNQLRPGVASARVTEAAAADFLRLAQRLELEKAAAPERPSKEQIAHFLMRLVFCLFADSVGLLPSHTFRGLVQTDRHSPIKFNRKLPHLFAAMSQPEGFFGISNIPHFNGGLFSDDRIIPLDHADLGVLHSATQHDWSHIEPAIFGTLFERSLDAAKRSMIGAHYTSSEDILLLIEPVVIAPLQRRWQQVQQQVLEALAAESPGTPVSEERMGHPGPSSDREIMRHPGPSSISLKERHPEPSSISQKERHPERSAAQSKDPEGVRPDSTVRTTPPRKPVFTRPTQPTLKLNRPALTLLQAWATELSQVRILDPACGSGNFLYLALKRLLDLWWEARRFGLAHGLTIALDPIPHPGQLFGIETDFYAHEIASIVVWIGFLQWKHDHAVKDDKEPLLQVLTNIQHADAILRYDDQGKPYEPTWPPAEYIVGNPPFLGDKLMRRELDIEPHPSYVDDLRSLYLTRVPGGADLVTYWFEKTRIAISEKKAERAGLLATQGIRGGANRAVLESIKRSGDIFWAYADRDWTLNGATVHVSMVAFDDASETVRHLNGLAVSTINADLTSGLNVTSAPILMENAGICFIGDQKGGPFDIPESDARKMLSAPMNPNGRSNADVLSKWINGADITGRPRSMFIIDFGVQMTAAEASLFEWPFEYVRQHVKPTRDSLRRDSYRVRWWLHQEARPGMRRAVKALRRYIATPRVSKHRLFTWIPTDTLPDSATFAFARDDDYFFGVLHSTVHELWARAQGTQLREVESGFRYTPNSTFDTFPFPWPPGTEPSESESPIVRAIAESARTLVRLRDAWLNPPDTPSHSISQSELKKRTLTNLYNARPTWLANAHRTLDESVFAAYGWPSNLTTQEILARLLALNHQRAAAQPAKPSAKPPKSRTSKRTQ